MTALLADDDFPVKEGKNTGAITSCLKVCYGKETTKKKKAASTAGSSATSVVGEKSDDEYDDDAPAPAPKGRKNEVIPTARGRLAARLRTRSPTTMPQAAEDEEADEGVTQAPQSKRKRSSVARASILGDQVKLRSIVPQRHGSFCKGYITTLPIMLTLR